MAEGGEGHGEQGSAPRDGAKAGAGEGRALAGCVEQGWGQALAGGVEHYWGRR